MNNKFYCLLIFITWISDIEFSLCSLFFLCCVVFCEYLVTRVTLPLYLFFRLLVIFISSSENSDRKQYKVYRLWFFKKNVKCELKLWCIFRYSWILLCLRQRFPWVLFLINERHLRGNLCSQSLFCLIRYCP